MATRTFFQQYDLNPTKSEGITMTVLTTPPTVIRSSQHADELGLVITVYNRTRLALDAYFQVYQTDLAEKRTYLDKSEVWDTEKSAVHQFDKWVTEKEASA
jgi:hypothetical protein